MFVNLPLINVNLQVTSNIVWWHPLHWVGIEKHLKIVNASESFQRTISFSFCFIKIKDWFDTHILCMMIVQNSPYMIIMKLYLLSIQKSPFIIVTMLTHYKCSETFTPEPNIYRGWTVVGYWDSFASAIWLGRKNPAKCIQKTSWWVNVFLVNLYSTMELSIIIHNIYTL